MREWRLTADDPLAMRFAADVRLGQTNPFDDQVWEVVFGSDQEPALCFQTRYGGRVALARLVPMWVHDAGSIYEGGQIAERPVLRAFAPNFARLTAKPMPWLDVTAELYVMESQVVGSRFLLHNSDSRSQSLRLELFAQVVREGGVLDMNLLRLDDGAQALHMGLAGNLNPVLMLDRAVETPMPGGHVSPKLSAPLTLDGGASLTLRWVHAGYASLNESVQQAYRWLHRGDWDAIFQGIERLDGTMPVIETGNKDWDKVIAFSQQVLLRSFVGPLNNLSHPFLVSARIPSRGFSPRGEGNSYQGSGQSAANGYLALPAAAVLAPDLARGTLLNALAVQKADGWIDFTPGIAPILPSREGLLCQPLLATTAWRLYELTEDKDFIAQVFSGLFRFFERWFAPDQDRDKDGLPEWASTIHSGYPDNPIFAPARRWSVNADISKAESPDLAAYLVAEATSLLEMAKLLGKTSESAAIKARLDVLVKQLESLWDKTTERYRYRDRDTHLTPSGKTLFTGKADQPFTTSTKLDSPDRLILRVVGGKEHIPRVTALIEGLDAKGQAISEKLDAFVWHYGLGSAVSERVYSVVTGVRFEGLSRVYSVEVATPDLTRHNQTLFLPLWAGAGSVSKRRASAMVKQIENPARYLDAFGMPVCPADDPAFAPDNDGGSGGVWLLWNTMLAEGLIEQGWPKAAFDLFSRILGAQIKALKQYRGFRAAYNSQTGDGLGDLDEVIGIVPLQLLMKLIGVRIINSRRVWAGGKHLFAGRVSVTQFGVSVTRSTAGTHVRFPSGYEVTVGSEWQVIEDPTPAPVERSQTEVSTQSPEAGAPTSGDSTMPNPPATASVIRVDAKKDDTLEVPITRIDFSEGTEKPGGPPDVGAAPGSVKIPVKGPKDS